VNGSASTVFVTLKFAIFVTRPIARAAHMGQQIVGFLVRYMILFVYGSMIKQFHIFMYINSMIRTVIILHGHYFCLTQPPIYFLLISHIGCQESLGCEGCDFEHSFELGGSLYCADCFDLKSTNQTT
jgi:hypothetical protein